MGGGTAFFVSRAANGVLSLLHVLLCIRAAGPALAAEFFLAWTGAWLVAALLRFGTDGVLPRAVAEAQVAGRPTESTRRVLIAGAAAAAIGLLPIAAMLGIRLDSNTLALTGLLSFAWAGTMLLSTLLRAHGRVGASGMVAYVLWPLGTLVAPLLMLLTEAPAGGLLQASAGFGLATALTAVLLCARALGWSPIAQLVGRRQPATPVDRDVLGAAVLTWLYELLVWLPVVLAALAGSSALVTGAAFVAVRVAGLVSWGYQAVVATLTPRLAQALAASRIAEARTLIRRGSVVGVGVTLPAAVLVAAAAGPLMKSFEPGYEALAPILIWLSVGRLVDAAAGPVGEALLVGRRALLDAALTAVGLTVAILLTLGIEPSVGPAAIGVGAAAAFVAVNALRVGAVAALVRRGWHGVDLLVPVPTGVWTWGLIAASGTAIGVLTGAIPEALRISAACLAAALAATSIVGVAVVRHGLAAALTSPIAVAGLVLVGHFAIRPATLALDPEAATQTVRVLGFSAQDIARATAVGVLGLTAFAAGFLLAWRAKNPSRQATSWRPSRGGLLLSSALGTLMWGTLFFRLGGPEAVAHDPAALHLGQFGGGYGTVGLALCFGAGLIALRSWCASGEAAYLRWAGIGGAAGLLGSVCLATRGLLVASLLAAVAVIIRWHRPSTRAVLVAGAVAALAITALTFARTLREYAQVSDVPAAAAAAVTTAPHRMLTADFVEFDHLVALTQLVPSTLDWLDGQSVAQVPAAFVPRALWDGKPLPLDFRVSLALTGQRNTAGTPFTLPGEAYWNFGVAGGALALLVLGLAAGAGWRVLASGTGVVGSTATAIVFGYSYLLLTRPLGAMSLTLGIALIGLGLASALCGRWRPGRLSRPPQLRTAFARIGRVRPPARPLDSAHR